MAMTPAGAVSPPPALDAGAKNEATSPPTEEPKTEEKPQPPQLPPMPQPRNPERTNSLLDAAAGLTRLHDSTSPSAEENKDAEASATKKEDSSPIAPATDGLRPPHHRDWRTAYVRDHQLPSFAERELALRQAAALERQMSPRLQGRLPPGMSSMSSLYGHPGAGYHDQVRLGGYDPLAMPTHSAPGLDRYGLAVADQMGALDRPFAAADRSFHPPYRASADARAKLPTPHQLKPPTNAKNFPETLYEVITNPKFNHIIAWLPHGKGFMIHNKELFGSIILPAYFDGAKFTSFTRRLKRWRFKRTARGPELGAYYNKNFMRDREDMVAKMTYHPIDEDVAGEENDAAKTAEGTGDSQAKGNDADSEKSRIQKKVEEKVQAKLLQKEKEAEEEKASTNNDDKASPSSSGKKRKQPAEPQPSVSPEIITTPYYMDAHALPLPSTLPKRPKQVKAARSSKQGNKAGGTKGKSEATKPQPHPGHHQKLHHGPGSSGLPGLPPEHPPTGGHHHHGPGKDPRERRLAELEAELALIRSQRSAAGLGPPAHHGMAAGPGPLAAASSYLPAHVPSLDPLASSTSRRILEVERAQRVLEAERVLEEERARVLRENGALARGMPAYGDYGALGREMIPPSVSRLRHYDPALGAAGGFPAGFGKLNHHPTVDGEERPVMMSKKEEEEFAEYLLAKRESAKQARRYERLV